MIDFGDRLDAAVATRGALCLGIDPHPALLGAWGLADDADGVRAFGLRAVAAATGRVGIVKPQVAFFERHGPAGFGALADVITAARTAGLLVVADAKRGDIGSTAEGYADAWLRPGAPLEADAVTAVAYQGLGSLDPLLRLAANSGKGVFVLAATSNPEARDTQSAIRADGVSVARGIVDDVRGRPETASGSIGVVVGATVALGDVGLDPGALEDLPVLAPGFGAQGARLEDLARIFGAPSPGPGGSRVIPSVSRSILAAGPDGIEDALDRAVSEFATAYEGRGAG